MPPAAELPAGPPLGFPRCQKCPYVRVGPARICVGCARTSLEPIAARACPVCSQMLAADGSCPNWLCTDPGRRIAQIDAIAYSSGELKQKIHRYKYNGKTGWALIFGRLLLGWLDGHATAAPDLSSRTLPTWRPVAPALVTSRRS
jgi:predicted amidophosphoribosyltransferase